jgi:hypothetical protein
VQSAIVLQFLKDSRSSMLSVIEPYVSPPNAPFATCCIVGAKGRSYTLDGVTGYAPLRRGACCPAAVRRRIIVAVSM